MPRTRQEAHTTQGFDVDALSQQFTALRERVEELKSLVFDKDKEIVGLTDKMKSLEAFTPLLEGQALLSQLRKLEAEKPSDYHFTSGHRITLSVGQGYPFVLMQLVDGNATVRLTRDEAHRFQQGLVEVATRAEAIGEIRNQLRPLLQAVRTALRISDEEAEFLKLEAKNV